MHLLAQGARTTHPECTHDTSHAAHPHKSRPLVCEKQKHGEFLDSHPIQENIMSPVISKLPGGTNAARDTGNQHVPRLKYQITTPRCKQKNIAPRTVLTVHKICLSSPICPGVSYFNPFTIASHHPYVAPNPSFHTAHVFRVNMSPTKACCTQIFAQT